MITNKLLSQEDYVLCLNWYQANKQSIISRLSIRLFKSINNFNSGHKKQLLSTADNNVNPSPPLLRIIFFLDVLIIATHMQL